MSQLLKKSKINLDMASYAWRNVSVDDIYITQTCYHLQQTLECALKYLLTLNEVLYPRTHDIRVLLDLCHGLELSPTIPQCFEDKASTYTNWEASSRYNDEFMATKTDIEEVFKILPDFVNSIDKLSVLTEIPEGAIEWCRANAPLAIRDYSDEDLWNEMKTSYYKFGPDSFNN